jgi:hypothetical protein
VRSEGSCGLFMSVGMCSRCAMGVEMGWWRRREILRPCHCDHDVKVSLAGWRRLDPGAKTFWPLRSSNTATTPRRHLKSPPIKVRCSPFRLY